jgi:hypothetical protein
MCRSFRTREQASHQGGEAFLADTDSIMGGLHSCELDHPRVSLDGAGMGFHFSNDAIFRNDLARCFTTTSMTVKVILRVQLFSSHFNARGSVFLSPLQSVE